MRAGCLAVWLVCVASVVGGCGGDGADEVARTPVVTVPPTGVVSSVAPSPTQAPPATPVLVASPTQPRPGPALEPLGFPLNEEMRTDLVTGTPGARTFIRGGGPSVREVSARLQVLDDGDAANGAGWNCRVHAEYEGGIPAVDWYVPEGTPVYATMNGTATLYINTWINAFDYYGVEREPYIGNPDRRRAPVVVFPGPSGGMGLYATVENELFRTAYGHFTLSTITLVPPAGSFIDGYEATFDYGATFNAPRPFGQTVAIARWSVRRGDVIGYTGDAGYSEAPHLHYQIVRLSDGRSLCPTGEAGFTDGGWLLRE